MRDKLVGLLRLIRIHNVVNALFAAATGYVVAAGRFELSLELMLAASVVGLVSAAGYVVNDYFDLEIDRINKPYRPLPSGVFTPGFAYRLAIGLFIVGVALSIPLGIPCIILAVVNAVLMYYYSKSIKRSGLPGNLVVAFSSFSSLLFGGLAYSSKANTLEPSLASLLPASYAFLVVLGREIVKGMEDVAGDSAKGVKTIAVTRGLKTAALAALIPLAAVVALSPMPYLLGLYGLTYLVIAVLGVDLPIVVSLMLIFQDPERYSPLARSMLKVSLFSGPLAFLVDIAVAVSATAA